MLCHYIHCVAKKWTVQLMVITFSKPNQFSKFVYCWKEEYIVNKTNIISPNTPKCVATLPVPAESQKFKFA